MNLKLTRIPAGGLVFLIYLCFKKITILITY
jgi:hypothetical protein